VNYKDVSDLSDGEGVSACWGDCVYY